MNSHAPGSSQEQLNAIMNELANSLQSVILLCDGLRLRGSDNEPALRSLCLAAHRAQQATGTLRALMEEPRPETSPE